jgi:hypothetical protein
MPAKKGENTTGVRVLPDRALHTHPKHVDGGLRAPDAETLAAIGGIDGPEEVHRADEVVELPAEDAAALARAKVVEEA